MQMTYSYSHNLLDCFFMLDNSRMSQEYRLLVFLALFMYYYLLEMMITMC